MVEVLAVLFGVSLVAGINTFNLMPGNISFLIFVVFTLASTIKDLKDYEGDKEEKIRTIPTLFGLETGKKNPGQLPVLHPPHAAKAFWRQRIPLLKKLGQEIYQVRK